MAYSVNFQQSNVADWIFDVQATDADTGDAIDFSTATEISFVMSEHCWPKITASLSNGMITLPVPTTIEVSIPASALQCVRSGGYPVGMTYEVNGEIVQLLVGSVSIYDGLARL